MIRRIGIITEVCHEAMFLRIPVDVVDQPLEIAIGGHFLAPITILEQTPGAPISVIDAFAVSVEKVRELLAGIL